MAYLLDTGILLRLVNVQDRLHGVVRSSIGSLGENHQELWITTQIVAEFCNVATRPVLSNGLGLATADAIRLLEHDIEPICAVLPETDRVHTELKRLITTYDVIGKQVHDARLVAMMLTWRIDKVLTLNERDFRRYEAEGILVAVPDTNLDSGSSL